MTKKTLFLRTLGFCTFLFKCHEELEYIGFNVVIYQDSVQAVQERTKDGMRFCQSVIRLCYHEFSVENLTFYEFLYNMG